MSSGLFCEDDFNFGRAAATGFEPFDSDVSESDPRHRRVSDHGTANQALEYALDVESGSAFGDVESFLRAWREGDLEEWPEFYDWLAEQE